jgi:hypothetical protein
MARMPAHCKLRNCIVNVLHTDGLIKTSRQRLPLGIAAYAAASDGLGSMTE